MKKLRKAMFMIIVFALCIAAVPMQADAASSKNKKAHKAYIKQIKKDKKKYRNGGTIKYAYKDLNGDGIDELITEPDAGYCSQIVYTYKGGKVKKLVEVGQGMFTKYYKKNKILYYWGGHDGNTHYEYYKFQNNKYKLVAQKDIIFSYNMETEEEIYTTSYYVKGKQVDKSTYSSYVKKLTNGEKAKFFRKIKRKKY